MVPLGAFFVSIGECAEKVTEFSPTSHTRLKIHVAFVAIVATLILRELMAYMLVAILWQFVATRGEVWQRLWQCGNSIIYLCQ